MDLINHLHYTRGSLQGILGILNISVVTNSDKIKLSKEMIKQVNKNFDLTEDLIKKIRLDLAEANRDMIKLRRENLEQSKALEASLGSIIDELSFEYTLIINEYVECFVFNLSLYYIIYRFIDFGTYINLFIIKMAVLFIS
jgi:hypothetical protein